MIINSEIANLQNSPGIQANTAANKPAANNVGIGTIYVSTDTGSIERSNGTTWLNLGGGGPVVTPGIDDVLSVGQVFSANQTIDLDNYQLQITNLTGQNVVTIDKNNVTTYGQGNSNIILDGANNSCKLYFVDSGSNNLLSVTQVNKLVQLGDFKTGANGVNFQLDSTNRLVYTQDQTITDGLYFDFNVQVYKLGKLTLGTEQMMVIDEFNQQTNFYFNGNLNGLNLDYSANTFQFGGLDGSINVDTYLNINQNSNSVQTFYNGNDNGFELDFQNRNFRFGDYQGIFGSSKLELIDNTGIATLKAVNETIIDTAKLNFPDPSIETTSSSGNSGNHLKVTVNGVNYVIRLELP
jgi:hypothetical protein